MRTPGIVRRHPELRWLLSLAVLGAAVALVATTLSGVLDDRQDALPSTDPHSLLARVHDVADQSEGYFGTVQTRVDLGFRRPLIQQLGALMPVGAVLLHGSRTLRYWYGGPERQRTAIVTRNGEQDVFRNGTSVQTWDSLTGAVTRRDLAATTLPDPLLSPETLAPPALADRLLSLAATSHIALRSGEQIAGRATYELVVTPDDPQSRIGSVLVEVDGREGVPLAVRIYPRGRIEPAVDVKFHDITFARPAAQNFQFSAPPRADAEPAITPVVPDPSGLDALGTPQRIGAGWASVVRYETTKRNAADAVRLVERHPVQVSGTWGTGLAGCVPILCAVATRTGELVTGAVSAAALVAALQQ